MKRFKNLIKKDNLIFFAILFIISLVISWNFTSGFATFDHYKMNYMGYVEYAKQLFLNDGRVFSGLCILFANFLNIDIKILHIISNILGIIIMCINVIYLKNILKSINENASEKILLLLSYITLFNFMYVNNMTFIEFPIMAISIFLYMVSAKMLFNNDNKLKTLSILILAVFCYQGTINVFFSTLVFLYFIKNDINFKELFILVVKSITFAMISIIINYVYIFIYSMLMNYNTRASLSLNSIFYNISQLIVNLKSVVFYSTFALPKYFYLFCLALLLIVFIYLSIAYKKQIKSIILKYFLMILCNIIVCIPLVIIFNMRDLYICGRLFWAIGATVGMLLTLLYIEIEKIDINQIKIIIIILTILYTLVQCFGMYNIMLRFKNANIVDREVCKNLESKVHQIEAENNIKINNLIFHLEYTNNGLSKTYSDLNSIRSYILSLSPLEMLLDFYTNLDVTINYSLDMTIDNSNTSNIDYKLDNSNLLVYIEI